MNFQLWTRDEYGQGSILQSGNSYESLVKAAKDSIQKENVDNSLTADEKRRNWSEMFIELIDEKSEELIENAMYAGIDNVGRHSVVLLEEDKPTTVGLDECACKVRAYLGVLDREPWFATDERGNLVTDISDRLLDGKISYFIRRIA